MQDTPGQGQALPRGVTVKYYPPYFRVAASVAALPISREAEDIVSVIPLTWPHSSVDKVAWRVI